MLNWNNITIKKLQEINEIDKNCNAIERTAWVVSILTETPYEEVEQWTLDKLRSIDLTFLQEIPKSKLNFTFKHKGKRYRLVKTAKKMKAHHFVELQELMKKDTIEVLPEIIACLSYRINILGQRKEDDYEEKVKDFADLPLVGFYNYAVFFSQLYPKLLEATLTYLKEKEAKMKEMLSDGLDSLTD
jgi:peroxiredoxin family protein